LTAHMFQVAKCDCLVEEDEICPICSHCDLCCICSIMDLEEEYVDTASEGELECSGLRFC